MRTHPDEVVATGVAKQQASWEAHVDALLDLTSGTSDWHYDAGKGKPNYNPGWGAHEEEYVFFWMQMEKEHV